MENGRESSSGGNIIKNFFFVTENCSTGLGLKYYTRQKIFILDLGVIFEGKAGSLPTNIRLVLGVGVMFEGKDSSLPANIRL
jgi:hypothetical protein